VTTRLAAVQFEGPNASSRALGHACGMAPGRGTGLGEVWVRPLVRHLSVYAVKKMELRDETGERWELVGKLEWVPRWHEVGAGTMCLRR